MKPPPFAYARAESLEHVFALLAEHGDEAKILAGGQSLIASLNMRLSSPAFLIDVNPLRDHLAGIWDHGDRIHIGALTRQAEVERSHDVANALPLLAAAMPHIAHPAIRNRGTIGGSLAFADPAAELPACAVALDATFVLQGPDDTRRIPAGDFFQGYYDTALRSDELLVGIDIPRPAPDQRSAFLELARRHGDYAICGIAAQATHTGDTLTDLRLVFFGVGPGPVLAHKATAALTDLSPPSIAAAQAALDDDLDPPGDLNGGPAVKRHLARILLARALQHMSGQRHAA